MFRSQLLGLVQFSVRLKKNGQVIHRKEGAGVVRAAGPLGGIQGLPQERLGLLKVSPVGQYPGQVGHRE